MSNKRLEQEWKHFTEKTEEEIEREAELAWKEYVKEHTLKVSIIAVICLFLFHDFISYWVKFAHPRFANEKIERIISVGNSDNVWIKEPIEAEDLKFEEYTTLEKHEKIMIKKRAKFSVTANLAAKNYMFWGNYLPKGRRTFQSTALMDLGLTWGRLAKSSVRDLYFFYCTKDTLARTFVTKLKWTTKILPLPWLYVEEHMLMVHAVPANSNVMFAMIFAPKNKPIKLDGYLVEIQDGNLVIPSERPKKGNAKGVASNVVMLVEQVQIADKIYR